MGAEELTGVRIDVLDLQPFRLLAAAGRLLGDHSLDGVVLTGVGDRSLDGVVFFGVGEVQAAEQQVGEQVGSALLLGAWRCQIFCVSSGPPS
jgi:hypothetical protein